MKTLVLGLALLLATAGCGAQERLKGQWKTEETPERTLDLFEDGTYSHRLSGKTLGFVSDLLGPEKGMWEVDGEVLVLTSKEGAEDIKRWPIAELSETAVVLGGDRWRKVK